MRRALCDHQVSAGARTNPKVAAEECGPRQYASGRVKVHCFIIGGQEVREGHAFECHDPQMPDPDGKVYVNCDHLPPCPICSNT